MDVRGFLVLTMRPGAYFGGVAPGCCQRRPFPLLGAFASRLVEAFLFFFPPLGEATFFFLLDVIFSDRRVSLVFGLHVRGTLSAKATPAPFGRLLGLLLWHHIGCRNQQLRQASISWVFGQRSRTVDLSGLRLPVLSKVRELRSRMESNYEKLIPCKRKKQLTARA